jgi:RHS repeat-associated protein
VRGIGAHVTAQTEAVSNAALYSFSIVNANGTSGYDAVGNVTAYNDSVNGTWSFNYDTLNRLATASGNQTDNPFPNFCWSYDSFGNRTDQMSASVVFPSGQGGTNSCSTTGALGQNVAATYNVSNTNRMDSTTQNPNQGSYYDASGNISNDGANQYLYDGEGRICAVDLQIPGVAPTEYIYDAEGNRVAKGTISTWSCDTTVNGFTAQSAYILGPKGEQMTEITYTVSAWQWAHTNVMASGLSATYDADPTEQTAGPLYFHLSDWLGTRRQQTDYAGNPVLNFAGLPYGDGLSTIPVSNIDVADATEHHFTGKERDTESGNDYFEARFYASSTGRFMSPDPSGLTYADPANPQSLNLYSYALNNPLINIDPTGLYCDYSDHDDSRSGFDQSQFDYNSDSRECGRNGGQWVDDAYTQNGADVAGRPQYAVSSNTNSGPWDLSTFNAYGLLWAAGALPTQLNYGPTDPETLALINRPLVQSQLAAYKQAGCPASGPATNAGQDSVAAYKETRADFASGNPNYVQAEVGGYSGNISTSGGVTTVTISNVSGISSFVGYSAGVGEVNKRLGTNLDRNALDRNSGPGRNVTQTFKWKEKSPCS